MDAGQDERGWSAPYARGAEPGQCFAQQAVKGSLLQSRLALQLLKRGTDLCFAKAEIAQGGEDLGANLEHLRLHALTIFSAIGMADAQSTALAPGETDLAAMGRAMMR